jgi:hypothetical protein
MKPFLSKQLTEESRRLQRCFTGPLPVGAYVPCLKPHIECKLFMLDIQNSLLRLHSVDWKLNTLSRNISFSNLVVILSLLGLEEFLEFGTFFQI